MYYCRRGPGLCVTFGCVKDRTIINFGANKDVGHKCVWILHCRDKCCIYDSVWLLQVVQIIFSSWCVLYSFYGQICNLQNPFITKQLAGSIYKIKGFFFVKYAVFFIIFFGWTQFSHSIFSPRRIAWICMGIWLCAQPSAETASKLENIILLSGWVSLLSEMRISASISLILDLNCVILLL